MTPIMRWGLVGLMLVGATGCGQASAPASAPSSYRVQSDMMAPPAPHQEAEPAQPSHEARPSRPRGHGRRHRPRGQTIYLRGVPIIPETVPIPHERRGTTIYLRGAPIIPETYVPPHQRHGTPIELRGVPMIPGVFDAPATRPEEVQRQSRRWAFARVKLTEVQARIAELESQLSYTTHLEVRARIESRLEENRRHEATLRAIVEGGSPQE